MMIPFSNSACVKQTRVDLYEVEIEVEGYLQGVTVDLLWDCLTSKRAFIELSAKKAGAGVKRKAEESKAPIKFWCSISKDWPRLSKFSMKWELIVWTTTWSSALCGVWPALMSNNLKVCRLNFQFLRNCRKFNSKCSDISLMMRLPSHSNPSLSAQLPDRRDQWLDRLRSMHLNGILADDMGLGKTLQAITTLTQFKLEHPKRPRLWSAQLRLSITGRKNLLNSIPSLKCWQWMEIQINEKNC